MGGVGTTSAEVARALLAAGHEVHVLADVDEDGAAEQLAAMREQAPGAVLHPRTERTPGADGRPSPATRATHHPIRGTLAGVAIHEQLAALHEAHRFDAIEFADFYGPAFWALRARRLHGAYTRATIAIRLHSPIGLLRRINGQSEVEPETASMEWLEAQSIDAADLLIAPSRAIVDELRRESAGEPSLPTVIERAERQGRVVIIPNPFDVARFARHAAQDDRAADTTPVVVMAGRLEWRKGADLLVEAAVSLLERGRRLRVRIVGVDTDTAFGRRSVARDLQRRMTERYRHAISIEQAMAFEHVPALLARASVVCVPSRWDNFPNACLEAMAMRRPVVAARAGGIPEIIEDGRSGFLFDSCSARSLAEVLDRVLSDAALSREISSRAPQRVRDLCEPVRVARSLTDALSAARPREALSARRIDATPTVAVIIPCYNMGQTLDQTLRSVREQTRAADEVVVVDDGSDDAATLDALERAAAAGVRLVRQANRGLPAARNAGIAATRADWILPLDADDLLAADAIECLLEVSARVPGLAAITGLVSCFVNAPEEPSLIYAPLGHVPDLLPAVNVAGSATALFRRDAIERVGGYDERWPALEDWDLWCRLAAAGFEWAIVPSVVLHRRLRNGSMLAAMRPAREQALRSELLRLHSALAKRPDRLARVLLAEGMRTAALALRDREQSASHAPQPPEATAPVGRLARLRRSLGLDRDG